MKPVIFDFDGVVIDSQSHWDKLSMEHLKLLIPGWTLEADRKLKGQSAEANYEMLVRDHNVTFSFEEFLAHIAEMAVEIYRTHAQLTDGITELLKRLQALDPSLPSIASASRIKWLNLALDRFSLRESFGHISTTEEVAHSKPAPDVYLKAAEKIQADPTSCIAIEDTDPGMQAAKAAGMFCIGFHAPGHEYQELSEANLHIESFHELTDDVLEKLLRS